MTEMNKEKQVETARVLKGIFEESYSSDKLVVDAGQFRNYLESMQGVVDCNCEGFSDEESVKQASTDTTFHFGHNHNFGSFKVKGRMRDRHTHVLAGFLTMFELPMDYFQGKLVLDVGCWTGGTSLMLAALGANVVACESVVKHAEMARYLAKSFGLDGRMEVISASLYTCEMKDHFDIVHFPGVLYHLSDPLVGLRILFNSLKVGGKILLESAARQLILNIEGEVKHGPYIEYFGPRRGGWNWFVPNKMALTNMMEDVGFSVNSIEYLGDRRIYALGTKEEWVGMCKAGVSRTDV